MTHDQPFSSAAGVAKPSNPARPEAAASRPQKIRFATVTMIVGLILTAAALGQSPDNATTPTAGMRITSNARLASGTYMLADPHDKGAIIIAGDDITVDFTGVTLIGARDHIDPDAYSGRAIVVRGRNVTIINATIRGYKVGIYAEESPAITVRGCDVSRNYRQRLKSTLQREDVSDWLWGHENDKNEWLRYGAGIYLFKCPGATVRDCRARNGQNGLCVVQSDRTYVVDNDMSFMSGWGLAMWRSSFCDIMNNKFDWCMRGYSHGVYSRGQDSAGILVYEQCSDNVFAYNSATHGGDGLFLYAGNETVKKTGTGGCNNNLIYQNDFSHAAANGIEATFSSGNAFVKNILDECNHGIWAGYSYDTIISQNTIRSCRNGVSIEHGRNNYIDRCMFQDTQRGVHLWWDDDRDLLVSPFAIAHDRCISADNEIRLNSFQRVQTAIRLDTDSGTYVVGNRFSGTATTVHLLGDIKGVQGTLSNDDAVRIRNDSNVQTAELLQSTAASRPVRDSPRPTVNEAAMQRCKTRQGKQDAFLPPAAPRGRKYIFIDEWGPYDFTDIRLFPSEVSGTASATIQLLGPVGTPFEITNIVGDVSVTPAKGKLPAMASVRANAPGIHPFAIDFLAGKTSLHAVGTLMSLDWHVAFYHWSPDEDPREGEENWKRITSRPPLETRQTQGLDFTWAGGAPSDKVPSDHFATVATATLDLPAGRWRIRTISDDGVRVYLDGEPVLANWTWHGPTPNETIVELDAHPHEIRLEHFEIDGFAQLQLTIESAE